MQMNKQTVTIKLKKCILFVSILGTNITNAQWVIQNTGFSDSTLVSGISIVDQNIVWISGIDDKIDYSGTGVFPGATFAKTSNGGLSWSPHIIPETVGMGAGGIAAINIDTAWIIMNNPDLGGGAVYRTNNGGVDWIKQASATFSAPKGLIKNIYFFNKYNGICIGDPNDGYWEIYTTANGGAIWTRVAKNNIPSPILDPDGAGETGYPGNMAISGDAIWFGSSANRVYRSFDKGLTWAVSMFPNSINGGDMSVSFRDSNNGLASKVYGGGSDLYSTINGGKTWSSVSHSGIINDVNLAYAPGNIPAYFSSGFSGTSYSIDDGITWIDIDFEEHSSIKFLNTNGTPLGWSGGINTNKTVGGIYKWNSPLTSLPKNNISKSVFNIYPNPSKDILIANTMNEVAEEIIITNFLGDVVEIIKPNTSITNIDLKKENSGVYFVKLILKDSEYVTKFILLK